MKEKNNIQHIRNTKSIILFDELCNFCDNSVQFVLNRDPKDKFLFASLQSEAAKEFMESQPKNIQKTDSIILVTADGVYSKSTAALKIANQLKGFLFLMSFFFIIPAIIRDLVYDFIAKRRYRWFGKFDQCKIPTPEERDKFLV